MVSRELVEKVVFNALDNLNEERAADDQLDVSPEAELFGGDSMLDSLSLVSMVVDIETEIAALYNAEISLTDDRAMSQEISPFKSVSALTDYILLLVSESGDAA
jgi:acyl carrier protein